MSAVGGVQRSSAEVKKKWTQLKSSAKTKAVSLNKDRAKTGGGPKTAPDLSEADSVVVGLISEASIKVVAGGIDLNSAVVDQLLAGILILIVRRKNYSDDSWACLAKYNYAHDDQSESGWG